MMHYKHVCGGGGVLADPTLHIVGGIAPIVIIVIRFKFFVLQVHH